MCLGLAALSHSCFSATDRVCHRSTHLLNIWRQETCASLLASVGTGFFITRSTALRRAKLRALPNPPDALSEASGFFKMLICLALYHRSMGDLNSYLVTDGSTECPLML
ncbi:hypothetical protein ES703_40724 [subsurface metagenome]